MKIIDYIRSRRKLSHQQARCGFLVYVFFNLVFTRFQSDEERWRAIRYKTDRAVDEELIAICERDALMAYSMLKIFKRVDADLALKSDQTDVYRMMQEVGFTYV